MAFALLSFLKHAWEEQCGTSLRLNLFVLPLVLLLSLLFLKLKLMSSRVGRLNLPPQPPKLPFIGNLHKLGTLPHRSLQVLSKKYGPMMFLKLGHTPTLVISSDQVVREMVKNHDITWSNRPKSISTQVFLYGCKDVGFSPYGEYWRQVRKVCVLELLSLRRVQSLQSVREEEVSTLINKIRKECRKGVPVNLSKMFLSVANNIIARSVVGRKLEDEDGNNSYADLSSKFMRQFTEFAIGDFFPCLGWMDVWTGLVSRLRKTSREMDAFLDQAIEEHKNILSDDDSQSSRKDFVQILLQLQRDDKLDFHMTQEHFKAILMDMFAGGGDTTFTTMEWAFSELIRNPSVMKKAQEEVRRVVGTKPMVQENDITQMHYLKCVMKETLRLHPAIPLLVPRETSSYIRLQGYDIPAQTRVFINAWAIQRDPNVWDLAEEFIPERFENNPIDYKGQDFQFIPFGIGRRGCPAIAFGMATAECAIANLLYWFDWMLPGAVDGKELDMSEVSGLTVSRKNHLCLVPVMISP